MNRAEKEALSKWLGEIADRLGSAQSEAEEYAAKNAAQDRDRYPMMVGSLQFRTNNAAEEIRAAIRAHLAPKKGRSR